MQRIALVLIAILTLFGCNTAKQDIRENAVNVTKRASTELAHQADIRKNSDAIQEDTQDIRKLEGLPDAAKPELDNIDRSAKDINLKAASTEEALNDVVTLSESIVEDTDKIENKPDFFSNVLGWIKKWIPLILLAVGLIYLLGSPFGGIITAALIKLFKMGFGVSRSTAEQMKLLHDAYEAAPTPELSNLVTLQRKSLKNEAMWRKIKEQKALKARPVIRPPKPKPKQSKK